MRGRLLIAMFVWICICIFIWYLANEDKCNQQGGLFVKPAGEIFYKCVPNDLRLDWNNKP